MNPFLTTERLILRRLTPDDAQELFELDSDPEVVRWANPGGRTTPYDEVRNRMLPRLLSYYERYSGYGFYAAEDKTTNEFLGWFFLRPESVDGRLPEEFAEVELGYRLKRSAWGKGYATEGSKGLLEKGFSELGATRVVAYVIVKNAASMRVLEKLGFRAVERFVNDDGHHEIRYVLERHECFRGW
jgi:RimJ/RimL family protein N-acetyltransferase